MAQLKNSRTTMLAESELLAGRYEFRKELGRGASGRVILVTDTGESNALRAVKVVQPEHGDRLSWEFSLLADIAHPNLARVYELLRIEKPVVGFEITAGTVALVEQFAPGRSADKVARDKPSRSRDLLRFVLWVAESVGRALSAIHAQGLLHGDIKPGNIIVSEEQNSCILIDLGLAQPAGAYRGLSGTPGFMAPETWLGESSSASDIYALGTTLYHLLQSVPEPITTESMSPSEYLEKALGVGSERFDFANWTPPALERLVRRMLVADPAERPSSAREIAARFSAIYNELFPEHGSGRVGAGADDVATPRERAMAARHLPFEGHGSALTRLGEVLCDFGGDSSRLIEVIGPAGSGRSRLVREAVRRIQASRVTARDVVPSYRRALEMPKEPIEEHAIVHFERADELDLEAARSLLRTAAVSGKRVSVILERRHAVGEAIARIELKPIATSEIERLLNAALQTEAVSPALVEAAVSASGGLSGRLCRILIQGLSEGMDMSRPENLLDLAYTQDSGRERIPESARPLTQLLACAGGSLPMRVVANSLQEPSRVARALQSLLASGLVSESHSGRIALRPDLVAGEAGFSAPAQLIERLLTFALEAENRGFLHAALGNVNRAYQAFTQAIAESRARGDPEKAARLAEQAIKRLSSQVADAHSLFLARADALRACGRYDLALQTLSDQDSAAAKLQRAELYRLKGELDSAQAEAEAARQAAQVDSSLEPQVRAVSARIALDRNQLDAAERIAGGVVGNDRARVRSLEVMALVSLYRGERARSAEQAAQALALIQQLADPALESRIMSVLASIASSQGEFQLAAQRFARAFELAERSGEFHAAASSLINLGLSRLDCAELGPAIMALNEGARRLARLGREADLARALYNLGNAAYLVGDDDLALGAVQQARRSAAIERDPWVDAYARLLETEVFARRGELDKLRERLVESPAFERLGFRDRAVIEARVSSLWLCVGDPQAARTGLERAVDALQNDRSDAAEIECAIAEAGVALYFSESHRAHGAAEKAYQIAQHHGAFEARLNATAIAVRAAEAAGRGAVASARSAELRSLLDFAVRGLTPTQRAQFRTVERYRRALEAMPKSSEFALHRQTDERWRKLASLAKRLTPEAGIGRLYEIVLDAAIELSGAERGFVVLRGREGEKLIKAARGIDRSDIERADNAFSRSIVARVIDQARPLATVDALSDERLHAAASVHALRLRSVLAVPLRLQAQVAGAIYLDDPLRPFAFSDQEIALLTDLAELAAIALDGAERLRAERRAARRLEAMRKRLARTVESQAVELASLRSRSLEGASGFPGIIGDSPSMRRVLQTVQRVAKSDLSVLILGESGTGKELIARAIHDLGARAKAPFISENCSAIPEQLLESALFGHVRGAFTGADRRRLGLFEIADGGTLFLDEIGDMSLGMQSRLLRALEEGQVRPVGGERTRRIDVRVLAATHRKLERMVADKSFRDDLYYRLAVVSIVIPPLRDRSEDIPALVAYFIAKHAKQRAVGIDRRALDYLSRRSWPGNVRQLENAIRRALVLSDEVIREEHLVDSSDPTSDRQVGEFDLKAQMRNLETRLIRRALEAARGNQTQAARLLGLSRYGLQKMLKRIDMESEN
ncbi:MAG: sigma 54-interacting transcriptional regulator [Deltaproteobacteria bacterium]|nr:sigma 54-interacting transcriptional regulator [Deltaproteobacteria bacterium]